MTSQRRENKDFHVNYNHFRGTSVSQFSNNSYNYGSYSLLSQRTQVNIPRQNSGYVPESLQTQPIESLFTRREKRADEDYEKLSDENSDDALRTSTHSFVNSNTTSQIFKRKNKHRAGVKLQARRLRGIMIKYFGQRGAQAFDECAYTKSRISAKEYTKDQETQTSDSDFQIETETNDADTETPLAS